MPIVWLLVLLGGALLVFSQPKTVTGYIEGHPVTLVVTSIGDGLYLRADAAGAFLAMRTACGLALGRAPMPSGASAAFRTTEQQLALVTVLGSYAGTDSGLAAAVGSSPHQAGIALDIACLDPAKDNYDAQLSLWLKDNCHTFGWQNRGDTFSKREPWHYEFHPEVYG